MAIVIAGREYVAGKGGRLERRWPKVKGKANVKAAKRARMKARNATRDGSLERSSLKFGLNY